MHDVYVCMSVFCDKRIEEWTGARESLYARLKNLDFILYVTGNQWRILGREIIQISLCIGITIAVWLIMWKERSQRQGNHLEGYTNGSSEHRWKAFPKQWLWGLINTH